MHTPVEFYVKIPVDLFRAGTAKKPKFEYLRTLPPRREDQVYDVKIDPQTGLIDHRSGGLSLFNTPNFSFGEDWWVIPAGTLLPPGFTLSKDTTNGRFYGHYTIRALADMREARWKQAMLEWADRYAIHISEYRKSANV